MNRISLLSCLLLAMLSQAQKGRHLSRATFKIAVMDSNSRVQFGYLAAVSDSSIVVFHSQVRFDQSLENMNANSIGYQNLQEVIIRRKGSTGRGILIGSISGFLVGAGIGAATYRPCECLLDPGKEGQTVGVGILGATGGGIVGGIIGAAEEDLYYR